MVSGVKNGGHMCMQQQRRRGGHRRCRQPATGGGGGGCGGGRRRVISKTMKTRATDPVHARAFENAKGPTIVIIININIIIV